MLRWAVALVAFTRAARAKLAAPRRTTAQPSAPVEDGVACCDSPRLEADFDADGTLQPAKWALAMSGGRSWRRGLLVALGLVLDPCKHARIVLVHHDVGEREPVQNGFEL